MENGLKICAKCKIEMDVSCFGLQKHKRGDKVYIYPYCMCKKCVRQKSSEHRIANKDNPQYHLNKHIWHLNNYVSQVGKGTTEEQKKKNKNYWHNNKEAEARKLVERKRKYRRTLAPIYVKQVLIKQMKDMGIEASIKDLTEQLITLKTQQLKSWRKLRELKN